MKFPQTERRVADESCGEAGHRVFPLGGDRLAGMRVTGAQ